MKVMQWPQYIPVNSGRLIRLNRDVLQFGTEDLASWYADTDDPDSPVHVVTPVGLIVNETSGEPQARTERSKLLEWDAVSPRISIARITEDGRTTAYWLLTIAEAGLDARATDRRRRDFDDEEDRLTPLMDFSHACLERARDARRISPRHRTQ